MELFKPKGLKRLSTHSGQLERWLGAEKIEYISKQFMHGGGPNVPWYGPPVNLADVPGSVWIGGDGDFVGDLGRGFFASAADSMADHLRRLWQRSGKPVYLREPQFGVGFTSLQDAIDRTRTGYRQFPAGNVVKNGPTGFLNSCMTLWKQGVVPAAGGASSAAPGGRVTDKSTTGAMNFNNPSAGTLHLTGADFSCTVINNSLMLYDRLFDVIKNMSIATAEAVTGVPTRYQSTTATNDDYIGGNFVFIEVDAGWGAGTAHIWQTCQYTDQAAAASTFPDMNGLSTAEIASQFEIPLNTWFFPLETGDLGVQTVTSMKLSAGVAAGNCFFVIAHPIGVMMFPQINGIIPFDWLTIRSQAPRIFNDACLALFEFPKIATTATTYAGQLQMVNAP